MRSWAFSYLFDFLVSISFCLVLGAGTETCPALDTKDQIR